MSDQEATRVLQNYRNIAVVGLSSHPEKPSRIVAEYLKAHGYRIIPVNPTVRGEILGETVYGDLKAIPEKVDVVEIFRPPQDVPPIVEDAIAIGAKAIWMQEGIVNTAAAERAKAAGLTVIMDRCMMTAHRNLLQR